MLPKTSQRVPSHTSSKVNQKIHSQTVENIRYFSNNDGKAIHARLKELEREWDIERTLETNASSLILIGLLMSLQNKRWMILPFGVAGFLLQHALQGWCPPLPILRRLGFRTSSEIDSEKYALKALRGDFERVSVRKKKDGQKISGVLEAIHKE